MERKEYGDKLLRLKRFGDVAARLCKVGKFLY
jgi:hypothetical protein